jgi:F-type H+-transporting ATPase subunit a
MEHGVILAPEILGHFGPLPITNTLLVSWIVMAVIIAISYLATRKVSIIPSGLQNLMEMVIEFGYTTVEELAHDKAKVIFPITMTFFLYIIIANWMGLLPGFSTIGFNEVENGKPVFVPLLRSLNSDLNMTLGLALFSAFITHAFAIRVLGAKEYLKKWFSLNPIFLFVGLLEIVSEFTKIISLSFRLFGNIFAGEVVLATVAGIFAFFAPLPFYLLEVIVGFVQAAVFMMLTLVFMVLLSEKHGSDEH